MTKTQFGITLMAFGGLVALVGGYIYNTASSKNNASRHKQVLEGQSKTDELVTRETDRVIVELSKLAENRPDLIQQYRTAYPLGFAVYGYQNGQLSWVPFGPTGTLQAKADWGRTKFDFDSIPGQIQFHLYDIEYDSPSMNASVDVLDVTGIPVEWRQHQENGLVGTPEGGFNVGIDIVEEGGSVVYVIGFKIASPDWATTWRQHPRPPQRRFTMHGMQMRPKG